MRILLIQPGATDFDEQRRIKGSLDIPLNANGAGQVARAADELSELSIDIVYAAPCRSAKQTAEALAAGREIKVRTVDNLRNLDHGLWHGQLIEDVKRRQPKVYRQWQDRPETVCPPEGETLQHAQERIQKVLAKILKKHKPGSTVALVVPEPLASVVRSQLSCCALGDLWEAECDTGRWEVLQIEPARLAVGP